MHQKKSEVQIGKESSCISSDFNPTPPLISPSPSSLHHKQHNNPQFSHYSQFGPQSFGAIVSSVTPPSSPSSSSIADSHKKPSLHIIINENDPVAPASSPTSATATKTTPHKRPHLGQPQFSSKSSNSMMKSPILSNSLHKYQFSSGPHEKTQTLHKFLSGFHHHRLLRYLHLRHLRSVSIDHNYFHIYSGKREE